MSKPNVSAEKVTILLAEDEQPLRELIKKILSTRKDQYDVLLAENGQNAFEISLAHEGKINLLISNVQMPGMSGLDLARKLKESRPEIRIMLMSGYAQGLLILDHGWSFIQKPFLPKTILDKIEEILAEPASDEMHIVSKTADS